MSKPKRITVELTENELAEVMNAVGHYKTVLKARAQRRQAKFGYRDDSPSRKRSSHAVTAQRKLSYAKRLLNGVITDRAEYFGA
jgi:hypothetical protein